MSTKIWGFELIRQSLSDAALFEQLAEEAAELSHAALKAARVLRGENPTPVTLEEAVEHCREELTDVTLVAAVGKLMPDMKLVCEKADRWIERLEEAKK